MAGRRGSTGPLDQRDPCGTGFSREEAGMCAINFAVGILDARLKLRPQPLRLHPIFPQQLLQPIHEHPAPLGQVPAMGVEQ